MIGFCSCLFVCFVCPSLPKSGKWTKGGKHTFLFHARVISCEVLINRISLLLRFFLSAYIAQQNLSNLRRCDDEITFSRSVIKLVTKKPTFLFFCTFSSQPNCWPYFGAQTEQNKVLTNKKYHVLNSNGIVVLWSIKKRGGEGGLRYFSTYERSLNTCCTRFMWRQRNGVFPQPDEFVG